MRILFVSHQIYPCVTGGTEVFNYHLARALCRDNEVALFSYCGSFFEGIDQVRVRKQRPTRYLTSLKLAFHILRKRKEIDVVFLSYSRSHWFEWSLFPLLKKLAGIRYVITIHGGGLTPWKPFFLYKWCFVNASKLIGISERICVEYRKRTGTDVLYIPPLFPFTKSDEDRDSIKGRYNLPSESKVILYVGSLKELKSPGTLLKAFNGLKKDLVKEKDIFLLVAGDGPLREVLEREALNPERTRFLGNVPREKMPDLYRIADLYVITSRFEGTPLSLLEAMYNRVPAIGSDMKGINSVIEDGLNGLLFDFQDHSQLSSKIEMFFRGDAPAAEMVERAEKAYRERFSYQKVLQAYQEIFRDAANEK